MLVRYFCDPDSPPHYPVWRPGGYVEHLRGVRMMERAPAGEVFGFDFAAGLDQVDLPVTIIAGTCSALGPDYQTRYQVPLFRHAEVIRIEDAGHRLFIEQPARVLAAVRGALLEYR